MKIMHEMMSHGMYWSLYGQPLTTLHCLPPTTHCRTGQGFLTVRFSQKKGNVLYGLLEGFHRI